MTGLGTGTTNCREVITSDVLIGRVLEIMAGTIEDYRNSVTQPWGKMFYDVLFGQFDALTGARSILDFGAGFCITADYLALDFDVTALEPNEEMYSRRFDHNGYTLITEGLDYLKTLESDSFGAVLCHNVLEYVEDKEEILNELVRILKPGGILSVVKHNVYGRALALAVLNDNPKAALDLLFEDKEDDCMFGHRNVYSNEDLISCLSDKADLVNVYGIRTCYGLSSNNDIKFTNNWYKSMLEFEKRTCTMEEYKKVAFFNHLQFRKK